MPARSAHHVPGGLRRRLGLPAADRFSTLLECLAGIVRSTCRTSNAAPGAPSFDMVTILDAQQQRAFNLLQTIEL